MSLQQQQEEVSTPPREPVLEALVVGVMPWLSARDLSSLACTCSALAAAASALHGLRASDITRGLEPCPVPAINTVDQNPYPPLSSYSPASSRWSVLPLQPWGHRTTDCRWSPQIPSTNCACAHRDRLDHRPIITADLCDIACNQGASNGRASREHGTASEEVQHSCRNSKSRSGLACSKNSHDGEPKKRQKFEVLVCGRTLDGNLAYDEDSKLCSLKSEDILGTPPTMLVMECGAACSCDQSCKYRVSQRGLAVSLAVIRHNLKGWGLHAAQFISRGSFVCEYAGELLTSQEAQRRQALYDVRQRLEKTFVPALLIFKEHLPSGLSCLRWNIDATEVGNVGRFINHACDGGNLLTCLIRQTGSVIPKLAFFASKDVEDGEELTFSYGAAQDGLGAKLCYCGTAKCEGFMPFEET